MAAAFAMSLAACANGPDAAPGPAVSVATPALGQDDYVSAPAEEYRIRPADIVSVTVFREPDLSLEAVRVDSAGRIGLPLVGSVSIGGMTAEAAGEHISQLYGERYLRRPSVAVNVTDLASHEVTVEGQVETPGVYRFQPGARLSGAIALAEGPAEAADSGNVAVFRQTDEGMMVAKFDYRAIQSGTMLDPVLQPGDRVVVGTSTLSQAWRDFLNTIPIFALFTRF